MGKPMKTIEIYKTASENDNIATKKHPKTMAPSKKYHPKTVTSSQKKKTDTDENLAACIAEAVKNSQHPLKNF